MKVLVEFGKPQEPGKEGHHYGYHLCDSPLEAALLAAQICRVLSDDPHEPLTVKDFLVKSYMPRRTWWSRLMDSWVTVTKFEGWATEEQIDTVAKHYIAACIWADKPEEMKREIKVPRATYAEAREQCAAFVKACGAHFNTAMACFKDGYGAHSDAGSAEAAFGHDFYFTRQRHGVGFWDRANEGLPKELGDKLTEIADGFGEVYVDFHGGKLRFV